jgi:hypothetical protein
MITHNMPLPRSPALALFLLSPVLGELVSAFLSPLEFLSLSNGRQWCDRHRLALVIGIMTFFLAFGILKDCESFTGRSLASAATLWLLLRLKRRRSQDLNDSTVVLRPS